LKFKENRLAKIKAAKEALEKREQELNPGKKIEDKKQISFADKEARIMGKNGNFQYAYNGQISVDKDNQIIVGEHLTQNANDKQEVTPALEEIKESTDKLPDVMSLDNGYMSGNNLAAFDDPDIDIDVYIATGKGENNDQRSLDECNRKVKKSDFVYDTNKDCFICTAGHMLELRTEPVMTRKYIRLEVKIVINVPTGTDAASRKKVTLGQFRLTVKSHCGKRWLKR